MQSFKTLAHKEMRATDQGKALISQAKDLAAKLFEPIEPAINKEADLTSLRDTQEAIANCLIDDALAGGEKYDVEIFPGATKKEILDVSMADIVGVHDDPKQALEWLWIDEHAAMERIDEDNCELVISLYEDIQNIPEKLLPVFSKANLCCARYIIFHQRAE